MKLLLGGALIWKWKHCSDWATSMNNRQHSKNFDRAMTDSSSFFAVWRGSRLFHNKVFSSQFDQVTYSKQTHICVNTISWLATVRKFSSMQIQVCRGGQGSSRTVEPWSSSSRFRSVLYNLKSVVFFWHGTSDSDCCPWNCWVLLES
jgi:hypothetical protein